MSQTLPLDAAQSHRRALVAEMLPGEELVLRSEGEPIAVVTRPPTTSLASWVGEAYQSLDGFGFR